MVELRNGGQKRLFGVEEPLLVTVPALKPTEACSPEHESDGRGKQEGRDHNRVPPGEELTVDGRSKGHPGQGPRQHPHGSELIAIMFGLDAGYTALNVVRCRWACAAREGRQR